jgi:hypothetical protein
VKICRSSSEDELQTDHIELELKVSPPSKAVHWQASTPLNGIANDASAGVTGFFKALRPKTQGLGVIALLSFQRPAPWPARKKASDSRQRPP